MMSDRAGKIMLVHGQCGNGSEESRLVRVLEKRLSRENMVVTTATDAQESMILFDPDIECALIDWNLENDPDHQAARLVLANIRRSKSNIPVFLFVTDNSAEDIRVDVLARVDGFIWILEDNMDAIVKDIILAVRRSNTPLLPPLFNADDVWKASCLTSRDGWNYFDFFGQRLVVFGQSDKSHIA
ncbi:MAG: hypothetical protein K1W05_03275 [Desulfovibrio sp.]|jgi:lysine decarboxylase/arginine decarboxylase